MTERVDVLIIGAGILGCFAARNLSRYELTTVVIEKNEDVCTEISKANTGIIYPGYDQHPGSLKASLCVKAAEKFPALCRELDVPYKKCGLLMPAFGPRAEQVIEKKMQQSIENHVKGVRLISGREAKEMEPALSGTIAKALYSENTCVVNPWELGIAAYENARENGVRFFFDQEAVKIVREEDGFSVETQDSRFYAKRLLICAGLKADVLWEKACLPRVRLVPLAADYIVLDTTVGNKVRHVISVEAEEKGKKLTIVPTVNGNLILGPTKRDPDPVSFGATDEAGLNELVTKCRNLLPSLPLTEIIRNFATVRPNPYLINEDGSLSDEKLNDFVILEEEGIFDLIGVKTPGITCANELGAYITERIVNSFEKRPGENLQFKAERAGIRKRTGADRNGNEELPRISAEDAEIICRCRHISKAEVLEAIRRGAVTVDGVKRRAGTGMGRCQGGYCEEKILRLLSEAGNKDIYTITKKGPGSPILEDG